MVLLEIQKRCFSVSPLSAAAAQVPQNLFKVIISVISVTIRHCYVISISIEKLEVFVQSTLFSSFFRDVVGGDVEVR